MTCVVVRQESEPIFFRLWILLRDETLKHSPRTNDTTCLRLLRQIFVLLVLFFVCFCLFIFLVRIHYEGFVAFKISTKINDSEWVNAFLFCTPTERWSEWRLFTHTSSAIIEIDADCIRLVRHIYRNFPLSMLVFSRTSKRITRSFVNENRTPATDEHDLKIHVSFSIA